LPKTLKTGYSYDRVVQQQQQQQQNKQPGNLFHEAEFASHLAKSSIGTAQQTDTLIVLKWSLMWLSSLMVKGEYY